MQKFEALRSPSQSSDSFNDYAIFVRNLSANPPVNPHAHWRDTVCASNAMYMHDALSSQASSGMDDVLDSSPVATSSSRSQCGYPMSFPLLSSENITSHIQVVGAMDTAAVLRYIEKEGVKSKLPVKMFWDSPIEAIRRVFGNEKCEELIAEAFSKCKRNERGYQNQLFLEFYKLKLQIIKCETPDQLANIHIDPEAMRNAYQGLSEIELRTGKSAMIFLQEELLPLVIREVPFVFIKSVATQAFDYTPNSEDQTSLWSQNSEYLWLRKENGAHVWSDSILKNKPSSKQYATEASVMSESLCSVYEAPWEAPWVHQEGDKKSRRAPRKPVNATARVVKLEGYKQGYVKSGNDPEPPVSTSLCLFPQEEDNFEIRNRDIFASDWDISEQPGVPMLMNDILNDLAVNSPASPVTAVKKRRMEESPETISKKLLDLSISENSPSESNNKVVFTVTKKPLTFSTSPKTVQKLDRILPDEILSERAKRAKRDSWDDYVKLNMI